MSDEPSGTDYKNSRREQIRYKSAGMSRESEAAGGWALAIVFFLLMWVGAWILPQILHLLETVF